MPEIKFTFDPAKVKITDGEILADLHYPVRGAKVRRQTRPVTRRQTARR